ncbi:energy-coupling factor ABC transporter ATP-binding protein [Sediminispirochaeta smaragdinae]|jgi:biotin transport system ATP-binding protein|nr:ABC transporter ATP-binding protein [Sediminispirochaeta smaragdinae]
MAERAEMILELRNVSRRFRDGTTALRNVSLSFTRGSFTLLLGTNGSGKSVLLKIIAGLLEPQEGSVVLEGKPLSDHGRSLHQKIGFIFQNPDSQIVGQTVEEDVAFGPRNLGCTESQIIERSEKALEKTGLLHLKDKRPHLLSGGEKRRLAVAGVEAMEPDIVLLDEPFGNLDYPGAIELLRILKGLKESGRTIILVTHDLMKSAALADRAIVLSKGSVVENGPLETMRERLKGFGIKPPPEAFPIEKCSWLDETA